MAVVVTNPQLVHAILLISKPVDTFAWFLIFSLMSWKIVSRPDALAARLIVNQKPCGFQLQLVAESLLEVWKKDKNLFCMKCQDLPDCHGGRGEWVFHLQSTAACHDGWQTVQAACPASSLGRDQPVRACLCTHVGSGLSLPAPADGGLELMDSTLVAPGSSGSISVCPASSRLLPQSSHLSSEQWPGEGEPTWFDFVFALKRCHRNRSLWPIWGFPIGRESQTLRSSIAFGKPRWVGRLVILPQFHNDITKASDLKQWGQGLSRLGGHLVIPSRTGVVGLWQAWWRQDTACGGCQVDVDYNYLPVLLLHTVSARSSHSPPLALNCSRLLRTMQCGVAAGVIVQGGPALQQHLHHTTNRNSFLLSPRFSTKSDNCKLC